MLSRLIAVWLIWGLGELFLFASPVWATDKDKPNAGIVIDFTDWSVNTKVDVTLDIQYKGILTKPCTYEGDAGFEPEDFAFAYAEMLKTAGVKAELFEKTKVRVLSFEKDGKVYPAIKGTVTSKTLKPELLPKVTNPPNA